MGVGAANGDPTTETILLVEDNPAYIRLVRELLREAGFDRFELEWADLLEKGLDRLEAGDVDLILLDLLLPDNMGTNTLEVVLENAPDTPIVVLTGIDDDELAREALEMGAADYLCKGRLDADRLARSIRYALEPSSSSDVPEQEATGTVGLERLLPATAGYLQLAADLLAQATEHLDPLAEPGAGRQLEADRVRFEVAARTLDEIVELASTSGTQERVSLHEIVDEALVRVSGDRGVGGRVTLDWSHTPTLLADRDRLTRLFDVVLAHVLADRGDGPAEIRIEADQKGDRWEVRIHDPRREPRRSDPLDQLFDVDGTPDRVHGPLARTLCEAIVTGYGGRIWVEPEPQAQGTVLCLTLPAPHAIATGTEVTPQTDRERPEAEGRG